MFGFLRLAHNVVSCTDREQYRAHFCAACHVMAESGGPLAALLTNYDQTFLQVVVSALDPQGERPPQRLPCTAVPFRRVMVQPVSPRMRPILAAINVALIEAKVRDDVADEGSARARVAAAVLSGRAQRAHTLLAAEGFPVDLLTSLPARQLAAEAAAQPSLDTLSEPTAATLEAIFGYAAVLTAQPTHTDALRSLGRALGRTLYVWDAFEDAPADLRKGRFNALVAVFGPEWSAPRIGAFLRESLAETRRALDALPLGPRRDIADGVLQSLAKKVSAALPPAPVPGTPPRRHLPWPLRGVLRSRRHVRGACDVFCCDIGVCECGGCHGCLGEEACAHCCSMADICCCHWGKLDSPFTNPAVARLFDVLLVIALIIAIVAIALYVTAPTPPPPPQPLRSQSPHRPNAHVEGRVVAVVEGVTLRWPRVRGRRTEPPAAEHVPRV